MQRRFILQFLIKTIIHTHSFFRIRQLAAARSGIIEALDTFHSVNYINIPELVNAAESCKGLSMVPDLYKKLDGVIHIGRNTIEIAFPVPRPITEGAIRTVDIQMKHPLIPPHSISLFSTSFVNYGAVRALALLTKRHCSETVLDHGICWHPCFNRGWRQKCHIGYRFRLPRSGTIDEEIVEPLDNALERPAGFCSPSLNPAIQLARLRDTCNEVQLNSTIQNDFERMSVIGCTEVGATYIIIV